MKSNEQIIREACIAANTEIDDLSLQTEETKAFIAELFK